MIICQYGRLGELVIHEALVHVFLVHVYVVSSYFKQPMIISIKLENVKFAT